MDVDYERMILKIIAYGIREAVRMNEKEKECKVRSNREDGSTRYACQGVSFKGYNLVLTTTSGRATRYALRAASVPTPSRRKFVRFRVLCNVQMMRAIVASRRDIYVTVCVQVRDAYLVFKLVL